MRVRYAWLLVLTSAIGLSAAGTGVSLVDAVKAGNREAVRALIRQRASINAPERDGMTALHWAVRADDADTDAAADPGRRQREGGEPLRHHAAGAGRHQCATPPSSRSS